MRLKDRVVLVMGASRAIGKAIAIEFAEQGAVTVVNSRPAPQAPAFVAELRERNFEAIWEPGDMGDPEAMVEVVNRVVARYGRLDAMVVSGSPDKGRASQFDVMPPEAYRDMLDGAFISRLNCLRAALKPMTAQGYGKVVFLTTDAGRTPTPSESLVGAAAAALMFFTRAAGRELAPKGIRLNCIATTVTLDTEQPPERLDPVLTKVFAKIKSKTPFGMNVPADIAKLALFLASAESDQISGATISINGGLSFP